MASPRPNRKGLWVTLGVIALVALTFGALKATGTLRAFGAQGGSDALRAQGASGANDSLRATGSQGGDLLSVRGGSSTVPLNVNGEHRLMPPEIRAWLEHLERIEKKRAELSGDQLSSAIITMTELQMGGSLEALQSMLSDPGEGGTEPKSPAETTKNGFEDYNEAWRKLEDEFASVPPPAECVPIRDRYNVALSETGHMIVEIVTQIANSENDRKGALNALNKMKGTSEARIGVPSRQTDGLVGDICHKYDTTKWFSINADFGGGMFGKLGL